MEKPPEIEKKRSETPEEAYFNLLKLYNSKLQEIKKMERRLPQGAADDESRKLILFIDKERNEIHNELKVIGEKLGKSDVDIMADILRQQGSLAEYGLPDLFILDADDMRSSEFNLDFDSMRPRKIKSPKNEYDGIDIAPSSVVIPYVISPRWYNELSSGEGGYLAPKDFSIRERRAEKLAEIANLEVISGTDYEYFHESNVDILGVVVPKNRLPEVARIIRENPDKFRVGENFYSDKDKEEIFKSYRQMIEDETEQRDAEYKEEYWEARKEFYGETPPTDAT